MTTDETPLNLAEIKRLLRLAEACERLGDKTHCCDPTTIAALCRANLRLVAMERALRECCDAGLSAADVSHRYGEILASMEKQD